MFGIFGGFHPQQRLSAPQNVPAAWGSICPGSARVTTTSRIFQNTSATHNTQLEYKHIQTTSYSRLFLIVSERFLAKQVATSIRSWWCFFCSYLLLEHEEYIKLVRIIIPFVVFSPKILCLNPPVLLSRSLGATLSSRASKYSSHLRVSLVRQSRDSDRSGRPVKASQQVQENVLLHDFSSKMHWSLVMRSLGGRDGKSIFCSSTRFVLEILGIAKWSVAKVSRKNPEAE